MVPEMIDSRIQIGPKNFYFFRNERRFGGNGMVPGYRLVQKHFISSETCGVLEEMGWFQK